MVLWSRCLIPISQVTLPCSIRTVRRFWNVYLQRALLQRAQIPVVLGIFSVMVWSDFLTYVILSDQKLSLLMQFCHINGSFISYLDESETCYCSYKASLLMLFKKLIVLTLVTDLCSQIYPDTLKQFSNY